MNFYIPNELVNYISLFCGNPLEFRCLCQEFDHIIRSRLNSLTITNEKGLIKNCCRLRKLTIENEIDPRLLELFLSEGKIEDLSCAEFTGSVSIFKDIKKLSLQNCKGLTDFEFLSKVEELDLSDTNFTCSTLIFEKVKKLSLQGCKGLTDFGSLSKVEELDLSYTNFTGSTLIFKDVKKLGLWRCKGLTDFGSLSKVEELDLSYTNFTGSVSIFNIFLF